MRAELGESGLEGEGEGGEEDVTVGDGGLCSQLHAQRGMGHKVALYQTIHTRITNCHQHNRTVIIIVCAGTCPVMCSHRFNAMSHYTNGWPHRCMFWLCTPTRGHTSCIQRSVA